MRRAGCVASARLRLSLNPPRKRYPVLNLRLGAAVPWAAVHKATVVLPRGVRLKPGFRSKLRVSSSADVSDLEVWPGQGKADGAKRSFLLLEKFGDPRHLQIRLGRGALTVPAKRIDAKRKLKFEVGVEFVDSRWGTLAGHQTLVRRAG
jgi:hypothetical protein